MDDEEYLNKIYGNLYNLIQVKNELIDDSVIKSILNIRPETLRSKFLEDSKNSYFEIPERILKKFLDDGLIKELDKNKYVITIKGVVKIEGHDFLSEYWDKRLFKNYKDIIKPLSDQEKIMVFVMICTRAFSKDSSINISERRYKHSWTNMFKTCLEKLTLLGVLSEENFNQAIKDLYDVKQEKLLLPIDALFARNKLPAKTGNIYKFISKNYWLNVAEGEKLNIQKINILFYKIFDKKKLTFVDKTNIYEFCCDISKESKITLFDVKKHLFAQPKFNNDIRKAIFL